MNGAVCDQRRAAHGPAGECPGLAGGTFLGYSTRHQAGQSFVHDEVELLGRLLEGAQRGADLRVLARAPAMARLMRKVATMRRRLAATQKKATDGVDV